MSTFLIVLAAEGGFNPLFFLLACFAIFYLLVFRPQRKEQQQRKEMIENLSKHDKVVTHGGIYGTVINVKRDDKKVVLKIDEATNSKLTVAQSAIASVVEKKKSKPDKDKEKEAANK